MLSARPERRATEKGKTMSNPLEDFAEEYLPVPREKSAAFGVQFGKDMLASMQHGAGLAAATATIGLAGMAANKVYGAATKSRDFRNMMSFNPDLQEHHDRDPRRFNQMYTSLRSMNSTFGKDPLVAGTYLRRMVENPLTAGGILTESAGDRKFPDPLANIFEAGQSGAKTHMGDIMKSRIKKQEEADKRKELSDKSSKWRAYDQAQAAFGGGRGP